ncbi:MAG: hypothetical protein IJC78_07480 [Clostridia bacterium]|nr:hypothetical protein [Clostridia bacterium]
MLYRIADEFLHVEGRESSYLKHRLNAYHVQVGGTVSADLNVTFKENQCIEVPAGKDFRRLDAWYWIDRGEEGYTAIKQFSKYRVNLVRVDIDKACRNATVEYVDIKDYLDVTTDYLLHFVLGDIMAFCQTVRGATVLHSAAVAYRGQAVLFSAPSETGKSTHTGLWKKFYPEDVILFNDDTPIIRNQGNQLYAFGTPWSGKTEINENIGAPLRAIVFLKQAKENSIRRLSTVEAAVRLVNETRKPVFEEMMKQHMQIIQNIIVNTPIYELSCNISKEAVDLVKETLFQE